MIRFNTDEFRKMLLGPNSSNHDIYRGLDRFGRVKDVYWRDYGSNTDAARLKYGYDRVGNRTWREDAVAVGQNKNFDELYAHDGLDRLGDMRRGRLNSTQDAITNLAFRQDWGLDATGNWAAFDEDADGDGSWDLVQSRSASTANEVSGITNTTGSAWAVPAYDATGNMTTLPQPAALGQSYSGTYDAWNRLVKLAAGANTVQENAYDAINRRTIRKSYAAGVLAETRHQYYSNDWQLLEERLGSAAAAERQFVWGLRYLDDLLLRDRDTDTDGNGTLDERLYALQDANWNVVALADAAGTIVERDAYAAYGEPRFLTAAYAPLAASAYDWEMLYAGYRLDGTGLYVVRNRLLHSRLGAWVQRDPIEYDAGDENLYANVGGRPLISGDPEGLAEEIGLGKAICRDAMGAAKSALLNSIPPVAAYNATQSGIAAGERAVDIWEGSDQYSIPTRLAITGGGALGEHIGVGGVTTAWDGRDAAGNYYTGPARFYEGGKGVLQVVLTAYGAKTLLSPGAATGTAGASSAGSFGYGRGGWLHPLSNRGLSLNPADWIGTRAIVGKARAAGFLVQRGLVSNTATAQATPRLNINAFASRAAAMEEYLHGRRIQRAIRRGDKIDAQWGAIEDIKIKSALLRGAEAGKSKESVQ